MKHKIISALLIFSILIAAVLSACSKQAKPTTLSEDTTMTVSFIDVGKGDCILIEKGSSVVLIDTGYENTAETVISYLEDRGISNIDYLIITHYDKDHVGGAAQIAKNFDIGQIYLPDYEGSSKYYTALMEAIEANSLTAERVSEDISFVLDEVGYTIYASDVEYDVSSGSEGNDNDVSLVITAQYGDDSYLFAGDIEKVGIKAYLAESHGEFDVLKMPHHGKSSGKLDEFIESVNPKIAIITDSTDTPAEDKTLELLAGVDVYHSSIDGTIVITGTGVGEYNISAKK